MKDVVLWLNTEFDRDHFKSHFELWTVNPLSMAEGMGWENRQYMLTAWDQKTEWDWQLINEAARNLNLPQYDHKGPEHNDLLAVAPDWSGKVLSRHLHGLITEKHPVFYGIKGNENGTYLYGETTGFSDTLKNWVDGVSRRWVQAGIRALEAGVVH